MPEYRNYNPNSKYGRRKMREQAARNYQNGSPEYRNSRDEAMAVFWVIAFIITLVVFVVVAYFKGADAAIKVIQ